MAAESGPEITVATWYSAGALSDQAGHRSAESSIAQLDADIIVLPDIYCDSREPADPDFAAREGYYLEIAEQSDTGRSLGMLARRGMDISIDTVDIGPREALHAEVRWPGAERTCDVYGVQFDEDDPTTREQMAHRLVEEFDLDGVWSQSPTVVAGDLRSIHPDSMMSLMLSHRPLEWLARKVMHPSANLPLPQTTEWARTDVVHEMTEQARLIDADSQRFRSTAYAGKLPIGQVDHILYSLGQMDVLKFRNIKPEGKFAGVSRRAIAATLRLRR